MRSYKSHSMPPASSGAEDGADRLPSEQLRASEPLAKAQFRVLCRNDARCWPRDMSVRH